MKTAESRRPSVRGWLIVVATLACVASPVLAQRGGRGGRGGGRIDPREFANQLGGSGDFYTPPDFRGNPPYDGRFTFARIKYRGYGRWSGREGPGWSHDYPDAEVHLTRILKEITSIRPFVESGRMLGGVIVGLDEPLLFKYPVAYLSEPGGWFPNDIEAKGLRTYLQKGGFLIVDDFPGQDWSTFQSAFGKAFPGLQPMELTGKEPIFDSFYKIDLNRVRGGNYGRQTYLGYYENNDPKKRMIAIVNYNADVGEAWQWSGTGWFPVDISNEAYKLGVNYFIYALTH
jgi:hypothetical protein